MRDGLAETELLIQNSGHRIEYRQQTVDIGRCAWKNGSSILGITDKHNTCVMCYVIKQRRKPMSHDVSRQRPIFDGRQYRPTKICRQTKSADFQHVRTFRPTSVESCCLIGCQQVP